MAFIRRRQLNFSLYSPHRSHFWQNNNNNNTDFTNKDFSFYYLFFFYYDLFLLGCNEMNGKQKLSALGIVKSRTAWKVSKYGYFSGPYFPAFGPEKTPHLGNFHAVRLSVIKYFCKTLPHRCLKETLEKGVKYVHSFF